MTTVRAYSNSPYSVRIDITGLQYDANLYDRFSAITYINGSVVTNSTWTSSHSYNSTSGFVNGLSPNTQYYIEAYGRWRGTDYFCGGASITTPNGDPVPDKITGVYANSVTDRNAYLMWDYTSSADGYSIYVDDVFYADTYDNGILVSLSYPRTSYKVCVAGYNSVGEGLKGCTSITTKGNETLPAPTNLSVVSNYTTLTVTWDSVSSATGYIVFLDDICIGRVSSEARGYYFRDLTPGTRYDICVRAYSSDDESYPSCISASTLPLPSGSIPKKPTNFVLGGCGDNDNHSFAVLNWDKFINSDWNDGVDEDSSIAGYRGFELILKRCYDSYTQTFNIARSRGHAILYELSFGTMYDAYVVAVNYNGRSESSSVVRFVTAAKPPDYINLVNVKNNNATLAFKCSGKHSGFKLYLYCEGEDSKTFTVPGSSTNEQTYVLYNLKNGKTYDVDIVTYYYNQSLDQMVVGRTRRTVSFTVNINRPLDWNWSYSGGNVFKTTTFGKTVYAYIMTASEWNDFTKRINEFRAYKNLPDYSFNNALSDGNFTVNYVNHAINAINALGFGIPIVSSDNIFASSFIEMRDKLNSIP